MSTRSAILFGDTVLPPIAKDHIAEAVIYKHCDGYPHGECGTLALLAQFFDRVERDCGTDTRYNDPCYLAAKFVVYYTQLYAEQRKPERATLKFIGMGVLGNSLNDLPGDLEYVYYLDCSNFQKRPNVLWGTYAEYMDAMDTRGDIEFGAR